MEEPVTTQSEQIEKAVAEKQFTEAEKKYLADQIRKALKNTINRCAQLGTFPDPECYGMMMHILEVLEQ